MYDRHFKVTRLTSELTPLPGLCGPSRRAGQADPKQIKVTDNKDFLKDKAKEKGPTLPRRPRSMKLASALMTWSCLSLASCRDLDPGKTHVKSVSVAIVSKLDQSPFFARISTEFDRVLVTDAGGSPDGININIPENMSLFSVELTDDILERLTTEVFHHGNIRLFFAYDEHHASVLLKKVRGFPHPRKIDLTARKMPALHNTTNFKIPLSTPNRPNEIIDIDSKKLREDLETLSGARPALVDGRQVVIANRATMDNKNLARKWLRHELEKSGYLVSEHSYGTGINLVADKPAHGSKDDPILMVTAHLDTVQTAGADDDGSGIITSLTVARALASKSLGRHLRFVAFDEEERGLIGSAAYAKQLAKSGEINSVSVINIEMTGYDSDNDGEFHAIDCNENTSSTLTETLLSTITSLGIPLRKTSACTNRSDHAVFWEYDRPAIVMSQNFFGGDSNPCYHKACDTVSQVNFDYMSKLSKAAANAVYRLSSPISD